MKNKKIISINTGEPAVIKHARTTVATLVDGTSKIVVNVVAKEQFGKAARTERKLGIYIAQNIDLKNKYRPLILMNPYIKGEKVNFSLE